MDERVWIIALMIFTNPVSSQAIWKIKLASTYELWFYNYAVTSFQAAKNLCTGGCVTYMDDAEVRNAVYTNIKGATPEYFWIGATGTMHKWTWLDGTSVDTSFIIWVKGQPDNYAYNEHNLLLRVSDLKYVDTYDHHQFSGTICQRQIVIRSGNSKLTIHRRTAGGEIKLTYENARNKCTNDNSRLVVLNNALKAILSPHLKNSEFHWVSAPNGICRAYAKNSLQSEICTSTKPYICEQIGAYNVRASDLIVTELSTKELRCTADGAPVPTVVWWKGTFKIADSSKSSNNRIYQTKSSGLSTLHLENANFSDEGVYRCVATNTIDGTRRESTATAQVKVAIKPTILSIQPHSCNSNLTITWKPHSRAVGARHTISVNQDDNRPQQSRNSTPSTYSDQVISFNNLAPSSFYQVVVSIGRYSVTNNSYTGGIPEPVEDATLTHSNGSCRVSWHRPLKTPQLLITGYKVNTSYTTARVFDVGAKREVEQYQETTSSLSFIIPHRPNRNHTVTIESKTCAGYGTPVTATRSCTTGVAAPESVEKLSGGTGKNVVSEDGQINFTINVPNEANGPISCIFVIAATENTAGYNDRFTEKDLKEANRTGNGTRYIAIAINRQSIVGRSDVNITLGNGSTTTCNIHKQPKTRRKRDISYNNSYVGQNNPLSTEKSYKLYIITATPSETDVFFQRSDALTIGQTPESTTPVSITVYIVLAAAVLLILAIVVTVVCIVKRKRESRPTDEGEEEHAYEYPAIQIGLEEEPGYANVGLQKEDEEPAYANAGLQKESGRNPGNQGELDTAYESYCDNQEAPQSSPYAEYVEPNSIATQIQPSEDYENPVAMYETVV